MGYRKEYITPEEYKCRYSAADGNFYTGYVIGLGYVYPKAVMLYPSHWCGYHSGSAHIPKDEMHCIGGWGYEVDNSMKAVIDSLAPLRDAFRKALVRENPDGTVTVYAGQNRLIHYPKGLGSCHIDFVGSQMDANQVALQISVEVKDDTGGVFKEECQILGKDLGMAFGLNSMPSSKSTMGDNKTWIDILEFWAGVGGILCSAGQAAGRAAYNSSLAVQFSTNFELMNLNHTKMMVDSHSKMWNGAADSPLVKKALTDKIPNASRFFPRAAPYLRSGGYVCGFAGIVCSGWRFWEACQNDDGLGMVDSGMDAIMGGVGFVPGYGWVISGGYFLLKPLVKKHAETVLKSQIETGVAGLPATLPFK